MFGLSWSPPTSPELPLPAGITRTYISTPSGRLELLSAIPSSSPGASPKTPLLFCHGGFGSASVWNEWMVFLSARHSIPCYAVSLRGHGASWYPGFFRMVFMTGIRALADDLVSAVDYVVRKTGEEVALVGHSSGGGLAQYILSRGMLGGDRKIKGLALCAGTPCYGQICVYKNWARHDPWFMVRMYYHLMHPKSPLSSTALVKGAFFSEQMSDAATRAFEQRLANYESYLWPSAMMSRSFINVRNVLGSLSTSGGCRVAVFAGGVDKLMAVEPMRKMAEIYRGATRRLRDEGRIEKSRDSSSEDERELDDRADGVVFYVVDGAGHHFQNDVMWEVGARRLAVWHEQL